MAISILSALWMAAAATGGGLLVLWACGLSATLRHGERAAFAFVIGIGLIGWLAFFPGIFGHFDATAFAVILVVMSTGLVLLRANADPTQPHVPLDAVAWVLVVGLGLMAAMDLAEALSPAADADTMAYHFETPRRFLAEGTIFAIPRAIDGVTQLLMQTTYGVAMALGGETAANLWAMLTGWSGGAAFYVIANRHIGRTWALTGTLALLTIPAVVYAGGTGQVEVRLAAFFLVAAYASAMSVVASQPRTTATGWATVAGLSAGFAAGSKMTGLVLIFAIVVTVLVSKGGFRRAVIISGVAAITGCQWYLFNGAATGDPLYPLLWPFATPSPGFEWNSDVAGELGRMWAAESTVPRNLLWFVAYPVRTILAPLPGFAALRTGFGPALLVACPFAVVAAWQLRQHFRIAPFARIMATALLFYTVWFFVGPSLQVRHLLAIYPLVLLCFIGGCAHVASSWLGMRRILLTGFAAVICIQLGGQAVFTKKFADYLWRGETDEAYFTHNISGYGAVAWINDNLTPSDRILVTQRDWLYRLNVPYFMAHPGLQTRIALHAGNRDVSRFIRQLQEEHITHAVIAAGALNDNSNTLGTFLSTLERLGCAVQIADVATVGQASRTLPGLQRVEHAYMIFRFDYPRCP